MGTRADFYIGRGKDAKWLGSIGYDGYPDGIPKKILTARGVGTFENRVKKFLKESEDATLPEHGWPWPWDNSQTTDYAYAFENYTLYITCFGRGWATYKEFKQYEKAYEKYERSCERYEQGLRQTEPKEPPELWGAEEKVEFPDMKEIKNVAMPGSKRSGMMVVTLK